MRLSSGERQTKGNNPNLPPPQDVVKEEDIRFSESTMKLLELEYGYAKENALLAITQRSTMMQVFVGAVGLIITVSIGFAKTVENAFSNVPLLCGFSMIGVAVSAFNMRGLLFLRSDWCDYVACMAKAKAFLLRMEDRSLRSQVLTDGLYHDPFHPPSRDLRTNFFYISYIFCSMVLFLSASLSVSFGLIIAMPTLSPFILLKGKPAETSLIFVLIIALSWVFARSTWSFMLKSKRSAIDLSPSVRGIPARATVKDLSQR